MKYQETHHSKKKYFIKLIFKKQRKSKKKKKEEIKSDKKKLNEKYRKFILMWYTYLFLIRMSKNKLKKLKENKEMGRKQNILREKCQ